MSMSTDKPPYIGSSLQNLALSDPRCNNDSCKAFYDEHQLSQKLVSYAHQFDYGHYVTWYYLAAIGVFAIAYFWRRWNDYMYDYRGKRVHIYPSPKDRGVGLWRYLAYRRYPGWISDRLDLPSMGLLAFLLFAVLFCSLLTFWARPYYRQHRGYGSPPIAVRTGLMAVALTPLIIALSGKANVITLLTGIGHEKLNVIHRWVSWLCFSLSVVHTVPFIVAPLKDGGYTALHKQFFKPGGFEYTGVPPLAILFGLLIFSLPWIRHRMYEGFYHLHFWLAVTYVGLMFWHCGLEGDSWDYMWATASIWMASILARALWYTRPTSILAERWFVGSPIILRAFPDDMTRLEILAPSGFRWNPGQHIYLRAPTVGLFDNHPFTIAAADGFRQDENEKEYTPRILPLYIRTYAGFTRRLRNCVDEESSAQLEAWLEGPYGGHDQDITIGFDNVILVAGGGGISAMLPWLEHFATKLRAGKIMQASSLRLYWSVKKQSAVSWIAEALERLRLRELRSKISIEIHVTQEEMADERFPIERASLEIDDSPSTENMLEKDREKFSGLQNKQRSDGELSIAMRCGRMRFEEIFANLPDGCRAIVVGCGPESLKIDLSNASAAVQARVFAGRVSEVALRTETFGW